MTEWQKYTPEHQEGHEQELYAAERHRMCLSQETLEGLRVTGIAI